MVERHQLPLNWKEWLALALAVILAVASMKPDDTVLVFVCLLAAAILGCWGVSGHQNLKRIYKLYICIAITQAALLLFIYLRAAAIEKELHNLEGTLLPGDGQTPQSDCLKDAPPGAMKIFLADSVIVTYDDVLDLISVKKVPLLTLQLKEVDWYLFKTRILKIKELKLLDDENKNIAYISDNDYWVSRSSRMVRSSRSNLQVFDSHGDKVLDIEFINDKSIRISGEFGYDKKSMVYIEDKLITINDGHAMYSNVCWRNFPTIFHFD